MNNMNNMDVDVRYTGFMERGISDQTSPFRPGIIFNDKEIETIEKSLEDIPWKKAELVGGNRNDTIRISDVKFIPFNDISMWFYQKIFGISKNVNESNYQFKLQGLVDRMQYGKYGKDGKYDWHQDNGPLKAGIRKLSFSVLLNDPDEFEGGDFQIMRSKKISNYKLKKGEIIFFPSWTLHRVKPVTSGERRSLVGWLGGDYFQ